MHNLSTATEQLLKPTATIHVGNKLSLIERKIFNAIIWHSQKSRFAKSTDTLSLGLLQSLIGLERSKNIEVIKDALEKLTTNPIVWNTLKKDRTTDWGVCTFLAGAELMGGKLRYVLNPVLIEKVNNPTLFAKIQLLVQTQFSSKYSLVLYEFLLDELGRAGNPETHEVQVSLDTVRHVLQFDGAYKHLNRDVLKPCVRELDKHTDISVKYRGIKKGRAVDAIRFSIERTAVQIQMPLDGDGTIEDVEDAARSTKARIARVLVEKGITRHMAKKLAETYDEARIRENLAYVEKEFAAGKVKNRTAYLIRAIEEDYRPKKTPDDVRQEEERERETRRQAQQHARAVLEGEWKKYRTKRARERFAALSSSEQEEQQDRFVESVRASNKILYDRYKKEGFKNKLVEMQFYADLCKVLLVDVAETDFDAYCREREHNDVPVSDTSD